MSRKKSKDPVVIDVRGARTADEIDERIREAYLKQALKDSQASAGLHDDLAAGFFPSRQFIDLLGLLFIGLKLSGHIAWSWFWVLLPVFSLPVLSLIVLILRGRPSNPTDAPEK